MKTAMMSSSSLSFGGVPGTSAGGSAAVETAVDAYATRVLQASTPPETILDTSLGPYVTSVLRSTDMAMNVDVTALAEFEALLELLEDQCNMERDAATSALKSIAEAVLTGVVPQQHQETCSLHNRGSSSGGFYFAAATPGNPDSFHPHASRMAVNLPSLQTSLEQLSIDPYTPNSAGGPSPLKPDNLIPVDLLGFLDDPSPHQWQQQQQQQGMMRTMYPKGSIPANVANSISVQVTPETRTFPPDEHKTSEEAFPPLGAATAAPTSKHSSSKKAKGGAKVKGSNKNNKNSDKELAAALFRPSRPRQNSIAENKEESSSSSSPPLTSMAHSAASVSSTATGPQHMTTMMMMHPHNQYLYQQQLDSCVEILLSMNTELSEAAAMEAAGMANADFNIAQYIVDRALSAPPVCRHVLHDGCYRSDCQFSHDVEGHTCLFWLRGRCTKPVTVCKFLHGFHSKLMEGIPANILAAANPGSSHPYPGAAPPPAFGGFALPPPGTHNPVTMSSSSWPQQQPLPSLTDSSASNSYSSSAGSTNGGSGTSSSFANIASRGYDNVNSRAYFASPSSSSQSPPVSLESNTTVIPTVRIPQNLWNPHENRDSSVFYIADPMERYRQVCAGNPRQEVIDLHFQSTKTFGAVLEQVLPTKSGDVWIVTGTGHHVGQKTHQKGGGALERAVIQWLQEHSYTFFRGKDRNGLGGALLVKQ